MAPPLLPFQPLPALHCVSPGHGDHGWSRAQSEPRFLTARVLSRLPASPTFPRRPSGRQPHPTCVVSQRLRVGVGPGRQPLLSCYSGRMPTRCLVVHLARVGGGGYLIRQLKSKVSE